MLLRGNANFSQILHLKFTFSTTFLIKDSSCIRGKTYVRSYGTYWLGNMELDPICPLPSSLLWIPGTDFSRRCGINTVRILSLTTFHSSIIGSETHTFQLGLKTNRPFSSSRGKFNGRNSSCPLSIRSSSCCQL